LEKEL
ncbi:hypothetical protein D030_1743B, partial [Vibrio parahaemolyticus AQ3810]